MNSSILETARQVDALLLPAEICGAEEARVSELIDKLEHGEITVSVIGQFKRGKSTLVNAILGEPLLPVGIIPVTSAVTRIRYGQRSAEVHFENGAILPVEFESLSDYISEQKNPDNRLAVASVTLRTPSDFLKDGLVFVDTPGVGSFHQHNSQAAYSFVRESDAVIFMLSVDSPINQIEIDFLEKVREFASKFYFAVNKIDTVSPEELSMYMDYCGALLRQLLNVDTVSMFPVSARQGDGLNELRTAIETDLRTSAEEILEESVRVKLRELIGGAIGRISLYWHALQLPPRKFEERFTQMRSIFDDVKEQAAEDWFRQGRDTATGHASQQTQETPAARDVRRVLLQNEIKRFLAAKIKELFGIEYHFELEELSLSPERSSSPPVTDDNSMTETVPDSSKDRQTEVWDRDVREEVADLCQEIDHDLTQIMMYQEEDTYVIAKKISDLNKLTRQLERLRARLGK